MLNPHCMLFESCTHNRSRSVTLHTQFHSSTDSPCRQLFRLQLHTARRQTIGRMYILPLSDIWQNRAYRNPCWNKYRLPMSIYSSLKKPQRKIVSVVQYAPDRHQFESRIAIPMNSKSARADRLAA